MFLRRKIALALLRTFGGTLAATDFFKLMFLLCQQTDQDFYDFFPYKYGAFSFTLLHDKAHLTKLGYLRDVDWFESTQLSDAAGKIPPALQNHLDSLKASIGALRGDDLLRKTYIDYPYYASRSLVAANILTSEHFERVTSTSIERTTKILFTLGYEGLSLDKYLDILIKNDVRVLVDVRKNPFSHKHGFSKSQLQKYVQAIGKSYLHIPELGVPSQMRTDLSSAEAYEKLFSFYDRTVLAGHTEALIQIQQLIDSHRRVALTCFEANYACCHRSRITTVFERDSEFTVPIVHL